MITPSPLLKHPLSRIFLSAAFVLGLVLPSHAAQITGLESPNSFVGDPSGKEYFISNINGEREARDNNGFITKLDPNGNTVFTSSNNLNGVTMFRSMRLKGNKVVLCGSSSNLSAALAVAWDTSGNLLWTGSFLGQSGKDVEIDDLCNTYLLSSYPNQVTPSSGQDIEIYKLNSSGAQVWKKNFEFSGYDYPTMFTLVADKLSVIGSGSSPTPA
ncbi:MAG: hypothetical protein HP492_00025 [Nitrospira sp.]|nr:hypothetical protein [Nitrospira sp.]